MIRFFAALALALPAVADAQSVATPPDPADWPAVVEEAEGQTVYWHAWGGDPRINAYIDWVADLARDRYGVEVEHVKLADTGEAVARVLAERTAGQDQGGAVDLIWINGENFASMKGAGLLHGPWAEALPNWDLVDVEGKPTVVNDFTVPTEGYEAPWGMAQLNFYYDSARVPEPPRTTDALLAWAEANPGRFAYPAPPDFLGGAFLKQVLLEQTRDPALLQQPVGEADYAAATAPLWNYLDRLTPHLWRGGRTYPRNQAQLRQLLGDGEVALAFSYNPAEASNAVAAGELPPTTRSYVLEGGTLANTHFVAIPYNASAKAGAMVLANVLLSPEAQARKHDPALWGDPTVLDVAGLPPGERAPFEALDLGAAAIPPEELGPALPEPHPSWIDRIEEEWTARYGVLQ